MKQTKVITCKCENPDIEYLDSNYVDHWVCNKCHQFGGCRYGDTIISPHEQSEVRYIPMNPCQNGNDIQHLEDKLDDFRTAVHDKVLSYGSLTKGIGIGLLIATIIMIFIMALGIFNFNPIVSPNNSTGGSTAPTVPTTPFPTLP